MQFKTVSLAALACSSFLTFTLQGQEKHPNVLIIMTDQQRWDALGCAGNMEIKTPNIDRMAKGGVQFNNTYSACPVSVPARSAILTGRTIFNVKVLGNGDIDNDNIPHLPTFDMILSDNGYHTEYYGKWHVPYQFAAKYNNAVRPTNKSKFTTVQTTVEGFRQYLDKIGDAKRPANANELIDNMSLRPYVPLPIDGRYGIKEEVEQTDQNVKPKRATNSQAENFGIFQAPANASLAAFEGSEALEALKKLNPGEPFSLTCSFGPPHPPFVVPKQYADQYDPHKLSVPKSINDDLKNAPYQRNNTAFDLRFENPEMVQAMKQVYYAMVTQVDEWVGKLLDELDKKGLTQNTLVVFVSDHGEMMGDHGLNSKMKMYEGSAHVPLIMRLPGRIPAGEKVNTPVSHLDLFATILDYTGMKIPENDGRSLRKLIEGKADPVDYAVSTWGQINNGGPFMIRKGDWKLIVYLQMNDKRQRSVTSALYNLKTDPLEMNNLIGSNPEKSKYEKEVSNLKSILKDWMVKTKTPYIKELENTVL
ncbi:MAG TPA: sulfatase-like hydrolase/transferase [Bacteroidales bacterium]|nr:sulfatase-like hydrolase/transferase [Bacteroidales bacterium]